MGYRVGVCGLGFGRHFARLFNAHPLCDEVVLCDLREEQIRAVAEETGIKGRTCASFDELVKTDVDAVAIFTPRWVHAPQAIEALKAGKHVYCAVPAGVTVGELDELVKTVEQTGLTYALGETSYYRPQTIWCRQKYAAGAFGDFVYGEGQYHHNIAHFYYPHRPDWKKYASVPPIWYISHSASHVLSVTFSRFTKVSAFGWRDCHEDGLFDLNLSHFGNFDLNLSHFGNPFSNQTALFRTGDGGTARINEFRRTAGGESRQSIIGTDGAYEEQCSPFWGNGSGARSQAVWVEHRWEHDPHNPGGSYNHPMAAHWLKQHREDMTWIHDLSQGVEITEENLGDLPRSYLGKRHLGVGPLHAVERLPKEFVGMRNGHFGSHQFLVQDFMEAMDTGKLPPNHVWLAARYSAGGAVAHESCMREGELLTVPDLGVPPEDSVCIDPLVMLRH
jgi:predicted dehydrogenase